ncbi:MAG: cache domain-containing protein, partial [Lachnospiraceae bacterium]|nr:cache domain-containing protein [Lachnospiraceae bacterium]
MKKINIKIIGKFKKLSMASKMTVALFVPMLVICMGILIICYPLMKNEYSEKVLQNTEQSAAQAGAFLDEYIREMSFSLEKICSDPEIIDILEREDFGVPKSVYAEYADFYKLHRRLSEDSEFDTRYQSAIYVPDVLSYATNRLFFYPQSDFENESGKERIEEAIRNRQYACATGVQKNMTSNEDFDEAFVMYRRIFSKEGGSLCIARSSIALSELKKILKNAGITEHTTFVILDKDNSVIYYTGDMKKDRLYKVVKQWKSSSMSGKLENRSYYGEAFYTKVSENSIRLLALIPAEEIDRQTNNIMYMFLAMGGILIFATLVISSTVVRGYVRRLTRLNEKMSAIRNGQMNLNLESP